MLNKTSISFKNAGVLNRLVEDYLDKKDKLKEFYSYFPDSAGFADALKNKYYGGLDRNLLTEILSSQAAGVVNSTEASLKNISLLNNSNSYTVTTGHQLCLFTGPLYFIYKILTTIKLAAKLKEQFPAFEFVPVYWMASEDHDFEEVNHFFSNGRKINWESTQTGAVGDFETKELQKVFHDVKELFGISENSSVLIDLFEQAYLNHEDLSSATRYLVNRLFGRYGLVTVNGNDSRLKAQFTNFFKKDVFDHVPFQNVSETNLKLEKLGYSIQVNPREINSFYMEKGLRARIEKKEGKFLVTGTEMSFSESELQKVIDSDPGKISPNVVTRPLYQQLILPNLAYVGGPGELAYWLQFKKMFDSFQVFFPVLMPRNFVSIIDKTTGTKIRKLGMESRDILKSEAELAKNMLDLKNMSVQLEDEVRATKALFEKLNEKMVQIDRTLKGKVSAVEHKVLTGLEQIAAKATKANKRKLETELTQLKKIKETLYPQGSPQERYENFSSFYLSYGEAFFDQLYAQFEPLDLRYIILSEQ